MLLKQANYGVKEKSFRGAKEKCLGFSTFKNENYN